AAVQNNRTFYYVELERNSPPVNIRDSNCISNLIVESSTWSDGRDAIAFCRNHGLMRFAGL
ncbi:hypothetical protein HAX54_018400, partial [Datura stramonium]|nr:hypothetical protein [Datura stramonium]